VTVRIYLKANFLGTILADARLPRPKAQDKDEFSETAASERIPDLDVDVMILSRFGDDHRLLKRLQGNRLWERLGVGEVRSRLRGARRPVVSGDRQLRSAQGARRSAGDLDRRAPDARRRRDPKMA